MCRILCRIFDVPTNLAIDDRLLDQALKIGGHATKRETVNEALREFVRRRKQKGVLKLFGKLSWDAKFDHKKERSR